MRVARLRGLAALAAAGVALAPVGGAALAQPAPADTAPPPTLEIRAAPGGLDSAAADSAARARAADESELRTLRDEIERARERALDLRGREAGILKNLDALDQEVGLQDRLLGKLLRKRERIQIELEQARFELNEASAELARRDALLRERLGAMYKLGKYHEYEVLLGSTSFVDLVRRYDFLLSVAMRDREMMRTHRRQKEEVERRAAGLRMVVSEIASVEQEAEEERARLLARRDQRERLLSEVRSERRTHEQVLAEMEESSQRLRSLLGELEDERAIERARAAGAPPGADGGGTVLAGREGALRWPAEGPLVGRFGRRVHPQFGTVTFSNGIDIAAPEGAEILCVGRGRVDYVSTLPGYGNCVIVNHGDGFYTLYAHASEVIVEQGALVEDGQAIARVGSTGSLAGSVLHFEIREGRKPLDPLAWLRKR